MNTPNKATCPRCQSDDGAMLKAENVRTDDDERFSLWACIRCCQYFLTRPPQQEERA